jgi:hypothetical protein
MIKTFEQFVSDKYGKSINEAYQSSKLREIIKQHGKPKNPKDNRMLYDIQDNEIIDVVSSSDEYMEKYSNNQKDFGDELNFMLELEDGACVVLGNLGITKRFAIPLKLSDYDKQSLFRTRRDKRHIGNLGDTGDDIHRRHLRNVDKILKGRRLEKLQKYIPEIVNLIETKMDEYDPTNDIKSISDSWTKTSVSDYIKIEKEIGGDTYEITIEYTVKLASDELNYEWGMESFWLYDEESGIEIMNEDLDITPETYKNLFYVYSTDFEDDPNDYESWTLADLDDFYRSRYAE